MSPALGGGGECLSAPYPYHLICSSPLSLIPIPIMEGFFSLILIPRRDPRLK